MIKIEKGVPMPRTCGRPCKYPFADMEVGDSIFVASPYHNAARSSAYGWGRQNGAKFKSLVNVDGVRIWRVA